MPDPIPVLFIAGTGRSGSTLLANLLGSHRGAVSVGEVRHIWRRGLVENWACGCGNRFDRCQFWQEVLRTAFPEGIDTSQLLESERSLLRMRNSRRTLHWMQHPELFPTRHLHYTGALISLYRAIHEVSGRKLIVDSSKTPSYASVLAALPEFDLRFLHLVRDPRATAFSWSHPKPSPDRPGSSSMDRLGVVKSTLLWVWWNRQTQELFRIREEIPHLTIRYESLMAAPWESMKRVIGHLAPELDLAMLPQTGHTVRLSQSHTVSGNPDRMRLGEMTLSADERWRTGLTSRQRTAVVAIGGPTMKRYGYRR